MSNDFEALARAGGECARQLSEKLMSEIDNCEFPPGTGNDMRAMSAVQLAALEMSVAQVLARANDMTFIAFVLQIEARVDELRQDKGTA